MSTVYWDSDCCLGWLQDEVDKAEVCKPVLDEAEAGRLRIVTSALTIAEVLALRGRPRLPDERRQAVEGFFRRSFFAVRSITRRDAERARDLVWEHGGAPKDPLHVATALQAGVNAFHTFDAELIRKSGAVAGLEIAKPYVHEPQLRLKSSG
jgi:predicted nucleic acid-binding protein